MKYGIDVSFHKGFPDWGQARDSVDFAILGVTQLYGKDDSFERNYAGCKDNGIPVGCYKFSYARSWDESKAEAREIVNILAGRPIEMGVWLDLEWSTQQTFPESVRRDIIEGFKSGIEEGGYTFGGIYCNGYWYQNFIPMYAKQAYNFWIASYPYNDYGVIVNSLKPSVANLSGWQYSERGRIPGFGDNNVDLDVWYASIPEAHESHGEATGGISDGLAGEKPVLSVGSVGEAVESLQEALNRYGYSLSVDGDFGPLTHTAVVDFQKKHGLIPDGIVGPHTWEAIDTGKTLDGLVQEVLDDKWGVDEDRKNRLTEAGYDYESIRKAVNEKLHYGQAY